MTVSRLSHALRGAPCMGLLALTALLAGCASTTPDYDARLGQALRQARQAQVIYPESPAAAEPALGLDGPAVREAMQRYRHSFREPPPVVNVIQIGGASSGR